MRRVIVAGSMVSALVLAGCQMNQDTQRALSQITGGLMGGLAGSLVGDGVGRYIAMGVGAAAGAWLAGEVFDALSPEDKAYAMDSVYQTASTGETVTWSNPNTKVSGKTTVTETKYTSEDVKIPVLKDRVSEVPPLDIIGEDYRARSGTNVRGGPGTDYVVVDGLRAGQDVEVIGKVRGTNWVMIAQNGIGSGFVREDLLKPAPVQTAEQRAQVIRYRAEAQKKDMQAGLVQEVSVQSTSECREMETEVTLTDGTISNQTVTACRGPNGWQI